MPRLRVVFLALLAIVAPNLCGADDLSLLREVAAEWIDERDRWAFTQRVREYDDERIEEERVERYDPSRGHASRWELVSINGRQPTTDERQQWQKRKNRSQKKKRSNIAENFDFANARVLRETKDAVVYELPLRSSVDWLFPVSKVELLVTINKSGPSLEQVQARINEPFRVALGLARILDIDLDVQMQPPPAPDPADAKPSGTAQAVVKKFGQRVEYEWSDFQRVGPSPLERDRAVE